MKMAFKVADEFPTASAALPVTDNCLKLSKPSSEYSRKSCFALDIRAWTVQLRVCNLQAHDTFKIVLCMQKVEQSLKPELFSHCMYLFIALLVNSSFLQLRAEVNVCKSFFFFFRRSTCFGFVEILCRIYFVFRSLYIVHGLKCVQNLCFRLDLFDLLIIQIHLI